MSLALLEPPTNSSPQTALYLSQQAKPFIASQATWLSRLPWPLSLFINTESQEKWAIYENIFLACLRTGDNASASACLDELTSRFGDSNERVAALNGMYREATAVDHKALSAVLAHYDEVLREDPRVFSIRKRRAALLRSMGNTAEAVQALTELLDISPTDAEAWSELGDLYLTQGMYEQAKYCLEEVLVVIPNAWNMHARLGEVLFLAAGKLEGAEKVKVLSESMRRFCRSVELCVGYLRGYYGMKMVWTRRILLRVYTFANVLQTTSRLLEVLPNTKKSTDSTGGLAPPSIQTVEDLHELATSKLAEILRRSTSREKGWDGYSVAEVIAVKELLDRSAQKIER